MFLTLFLASSVFQGTAWEENMKNLALFYVLFLPVCYVSQKQRWENYTFKGLGAAE